jgi:hypothetical protein
VCDPGYWGAPGPDRYNWTVTLFGGQTDPIAAGRTAELGEARSRAEGALHGYAEGGGRSVTGQALLATRSLARSF